MKKQERSGLHGLPESIDVQNVGTIWSKDIVLAIGWVQFDSVFQKSAKSNSTKPPIHLVCRILWFLGPKCTYFLFFLFEKVVGGFDEHFTPILEDQNDFSFKKIQVFGDRQNYSTNWIKHKSQYLLQLNSLLINE